jgi:hypothetical protein
MKPPFSIEEFFEVFARYNHAVWPVQILLLGLGIAAVAVIRWSPRRGRIVTAILSFLWCWMALAYHFNQFSRIASVAWWFGSLFSLQAGFFAWWSFRSESLEFWPVRRRRAMVGWFLVSYGLVVYPILSVVLGHDYMRSPTFGVPCPTTIYTFGIFWLAKPPVPRHLLVVPIIWSAIGGSAAFYLDVPQDLGLVVAGATGFSLLVFRNERAQRRRSRAV